MAMRMGQMSRFEALGSGVLARERTRANRPDLQQFLLNPLDPFFKLLWAHGNSVSDVIR